MLLFYWDFDYDDRELDATIESTDDDQEYWRHEVVSVRSVYGDGRLPIHLFLPKNVEPPYQAVVYFPPSSAKYLTDSRTPSFPLAHFIPKSGRALVYPIYQGTYERQVDRRGPNDATISGRPSKPTSSRCSTFWEHPTGTSA